MTHPTPTDFYAITAIFTTMAENVIITCATFQNPGTISAALLLTYRLLTFQTKMGKTYFAIFWLGVSGFAMHFQIILLSRPRTDSKIPTLDRCV